MYSVTFRHCDAVGDEIKYFSAFTFQCFCHNKFRLQFIDSLNVYIIKMFEFQPHKAPPAAVSARRSALRQLNTSNIL